MKKLIILLITIVFSGFLHPGLASGLAYSRSSMSINGTSASASNYTFTSPANASLSVTTLTGTTVLIGASTDNQASAVTNIGFDFVFMGKPYSQFSVNDNGQLMLGSTQIAGDTYTLNTSSTNPVLSAFGANLRVGTTGYVIYSLMGSAPNRTLCVQWANMMLVSATAAAASSVFEVRLHETSGVFEFVYGPMSSNLNPVSPTYYTVGFAVGGSFMNVNTTTNTFSTSSVITSNTYVSGTITALNSVTNVTRRMYQFTPPNTAPTVPTPLTFAQVNKNSMGLYWTDVSNETNYAIYRSDDNGVTYKLAGTVLSDVSSYNTGAVLSPGTTYKWKVYSLNEGRFSTTAATGTVTTDPATSITSTGSGKWSSTLPDQPWPNGVVPDKTSNVIIADGSNIVLDTLGLVCNNLTIGQGSTGSLEYTSAQAADLHVYGDLSLSSGASFISGPGSISAHTLEIGASATNGIAGNLANNGGTFNMKSGGNTVETTFYGSLYSSISGSQCDFSDLTVSKGGDATSTLEVLAPITLRAATTDKSLNLNSGTLKITSASNITPWGGNQTIIPLTSSLILNNPSCVLNVGGAGSPKISGQLIIDSGTMVYGTGNETLTVDTYGSITLNGGVLKMNGAVAFAQSATSKLTIAGTGELDVDIQPALGNALSTVTTAVAINSAMTLNWTGGKIVILNPHSAQGGMVWNPSIGGSKSITGGTLQIGSPTATGTSLGTNTAGFGITCPSTLAVYNLEINNNISASNSRMARIVGSVYVQNNVLIDNNSYLFLGNGSTGGTLYVSNSITNNGVVAGCEPSGSQHVGALYFNGPAATIYNPSGVSNAVNLSTLVSGTSSSVTMTINDPIAFDKVILYSGHINPTNLTIGSSAVKPIVQIGGIGTTVPSLVSFTAVPSFQGGVANAGFSYESCTAALTMGAYNELPASGPYTVDLLSINNTTGLTTSGVLQVNNSLFMKGGNITIGSNDITLGKSALANECGTLTWVSGYLITNSNSGGGFTRWYPTTGVLLPTSSSNIIGYYPVAIMLKGVVTPQDVHVYFTTSSALSAPSSGGSIKVKLENHTGLQDLSTYTPQYADAGQTINTATQAYWTLLAGDGMQSAGSINVTVLGTSALFTTDVSKLVLLKTTDPNPTISGIAGTNGGTSSAPVVVRKFLHSADLTGDPVYIGGNTNEVSSLVYTLANVHGGWRDPASWDLGGTETPTSLQAAVVVAGSVISVTDASAIKTVTVNSGGTLNIVSGANFTAEGASQTGISIGGTLNVNAGTFTIGTAANNRTLVTSGTGLFKIAGGVVNMNGNINIPSNTSFQMTGGQLNINGNNGVSSESATTAGTPLLNIAGTPTVSGGTILFVNPHYDRNQYTLSYSNTTASVNFSSTNTVQFGDGVSTIKGAINGGVGGFLINPGSTFKLAFNHVDINGGSAIGRGVKFISTIGVLGNLTIEANSTLSDSISTSAGLYVKGNITNNGILKLSGATGFLSTQNFTSGAVANTPTSQIIGGSGTYNIQKFVVGTTYALGVALAASITTPNLTLTSGILASSVNPVTSTEYGIAVSGTSYNAITGGSTTNYVKGPLTWNLPTNLSTGTSYILPIGGSSYSPLTFVSATTSAGSNLTLTAEVFETPTANSAGSAMHSLVSNKYWKASFAGSGTLTSGVQLTDVSASSSTLNAIASSPTLDSQFVLLGGNNPIITGSTSIQTEENTVSFTASDNYFALGRKVMTYYSNALNHDRESVLKGGFNQEVKGIKIVTNASDEALSVTAFTFDTNNPSGTTNLSDISNAKIWKTQDSIFNLTASPAPIQIGSVVASPNGIFTITANEALTAGANYFWLTYDIASTAILGNHVEAKCQSFAINSTYTIPVTDNFTSSVIKAQLAGGYTVGNTGADYTSLTGAGGLFSDIAALGLKGNVNVTVISNLNEDGSNTFGSWTGGYTINIASDLPVVRTITNTSSTPLIHFTGASGVKIDGRVGGSGKYLSFVNNDVNNPTFIFDSGSSNTVEFCTIQGADSSRASGVIKLPNTAESITIDNCLIKDAATRPANMFYFSNVASSNNIITNNSLTDFTAYGIYLNGANQTLVSSNTINMTVPSLRDSVGGIFVGKAPNTTILNNHILNLSGTAASEVRGILYIGSNSTVSVSLVNNSIALSPSSYGALYGIDYNGFQTNSLNAYYNSILLSGTQTQDHANTYNFLKQGKINILDIKNNVFENARLNSGATSLHYVLGLPDNTTSGSITIDFNDYYATDAGGFLANWGGTDYTTFTSWKGASTKDGSSKNLAPTFVSTTDLHLTNVNCQLNGAATPVVGVTTDIDGATRDAITPDLGIAEFTTRHPAVLTQPADASTTVYSTASFTTAPVVAGDVFSYSWQVSTDGGATYTNLSGNATYVGVDTETLSITKCLRNMDGYKFRCSLASDCNTVTTAGASLTVNKAVLTVTAIDKSRHYHTPNPVFETNITGFLDGEVLATSDVTGEGGTSCTATLTSPVGNESIVASSGTLSSNNYSFVYVNGTLTIDKYPLIVTAKPASRIYGGANPVFVAELSSFPSGVTESTTDITLLSAPTCTATTTTPAGASVISADGETFSSSNYTIGTRIDGVLTINKANLSVRALDASRLYHQTDPIFTTKLEGFVAGDSETNCDVTGVASASSTADITTAVGTSVIVPNVSGLSSNNYNFVSVNGILSINKYPLTVTVKPSSKVYGHANPSFVAEFTSFPAGVTESATDITVVAEPTSTATLLTPVGTAAIQANSGTYTSNNYSFSTFTDGVLTITKAVLTVTAHDDNRPFGGANPAFGSTISGYLNSETNITAGVTGVANVTTTATGSTPAGPAVITAGIGTLSAPNYSFVGVDGVLTITQLSQTITLNGGTTISKAMGDDNFTVSAVGGLSGNPVTFSSSNNSVATVSGNVVTIVNGGTCSIYADQAGSTNYSAAPQVSWTLNVSTPAGAIWNGTSWSTLPTSGADAMINGTYNEASSFECQNLLIGAGKQLIINSGQYVKVNGTLTNKNGVNGILVKPGGSLIHSTSGVLGSVEMDITGGGVYGTTMKWHFIGSPVAPFAANSLFSGIKVYSYSESETESKLAWPALTGSLVAPNGYLLQSPSNVTKTFTGVLNEGNYSLVDQSYSNPNAASKGTHLVSNPYPSPIDWNVVFTASTNIKNEFWAWNSITRTYGYWNGTVGVNGVSNIIPVGQGFGIQVLGASNRIAFSNAARQAASISMLKGANIIPNLLKLRVSDQSTYDEAALYFGEHAQQTLKMMSMSSLTPQIYIKDSVGKQAITCFEGAVVTKDIALNFSCGVAGTFSLSTSQQTFGDDVLITLEDLKLKKTVKLNSNLNYAFDYETNDLPARFIVHILVNPTAVKDVDEEDVKIYSSGRKIYIQSNTSKFGMASIYDIQGRLIVQKQIESSRDSFDMGGRALGVYVVKYLVGQTVYTEKLVVE